MEDANGPLGQRVPNHAAECGSHDAARNTDCERHAGPDPIFRPDDAKCPLRRLMGEGVGVKMNQRPVVEQEGPGSGAKAQNLKHID